MKDAINRVGDKFDLPTGWLNADFTHTDSYSPKLTQYSIFYRQFANVLTVRTVSAEYLIAMKLRSGRKYKNDLSDIIGILAEHERKGCPISRSAIEKAVVNLYGNWENISEDSIAFLSNAMSNGSFEQVYDTVRNEEKRSKEVLVKFEQDYPDVTTQENVDSILETLKKKEASKTSLLEQLKQQELKKLRRG